jgi:hypothetical protein
MRLRRDPVPLEDDDPGSRYRAGKATGFTSMLWRVRARLTDTETGEVMELRSLGAAEELCELLGQADAGRLPRLPVDASPFRRYEASRMPSGWSILWHAEGALNHEPFARTRSEALARRAVDALNRAHPRKLRDPLGPPKAGWF